MNKLGVKIEVTINHSGRKETRLYHTGRVNNSAYTCWDLSWSGLKIQMPAPKTHSVNVPGRDGELDLTEALNDYVRYDNRQILLTFTAKDLSYDEWQKKLSSIASALHGRKLKLWLDTDPLYYYEGRASVEATKETPAGSELVITLNSDPYKKRIAAGDWLWDPFNFETDVIHGADTRAVKYSVGNSYDSSGWYATKIMLPATRMPVKPKITVHTLAHTSPATLSIEVREWTGRPSKFDEDLTSKYYYYYLDDSVAVANAIDIPLGQAKRISAPNLLLGDYNTRLVIGAIIYGDTPPVEVTVGEGLVSIDIEYEIGVL